MKMKLNAFGSIVLILALLVPSSSASAETSTAFTEIQSLFDMVASRFSEKDVEGVARSSSSGSTLRYLNGSTFTF